jgi:hypothetical protein
MCRVEVAFAVDRFIENGFATNHRLWPQRIYVLWAVRGGLRAAGELTEVSARDFCVGMPERIERYGHDVIERSKQRVNDSQYVSTHMNRKPARVLGGTA